ncbi:MULTISPECIES: DUF2606 family protein [Bacillus]|uniref:DUF2606 family protein n=1 Tax=Bacillus glycinifermentans TaxID=1664069 RepID=A0A0T6BIK3_9BACI|nr:MULTISPECIES: DUF2606 family protein [Bacillus]KRT87088.1 hypothetical protein AB447_208965 [Bacillus glycinifermentans]MEC0341861.1 DUF2606 family protein [Bacillus sonorensis]MEC0457453.1 DUF2606 family protein [Bacillus sonorensis]MEC0487136.1 DUF2606 family protein [Bacillus glycinifermentans]MEC0530752.1 DUF2606 family protein [Bacillus sonorensis]
MKFISNFILLTLSFIIICGCSNTNHKDHPIKEDKPILTSVTIKVSDKDKKPLQNIRAVEDAKPDRENSRATIGHTIGITNKDGNIEWEVETGEHVIILYAPKPEDDFRKYTVNITEDSTTIDLVYK